LNRDDGAASAVLEQIAAAQASLHPRNGSTRSRRAGAVLHLWQLHLRKINNTRHRVSA